MIPTPTRNVSLPFQQGGFKSLCEVLDYAAQGDTGLNFHDVRGRLEQTLSYVHLRRSAVAVAKRLRERGLTIGSPIALVAETSPAFLKLFYACQYAGFVPCPLPHHLRTGAPDAYVAQLRQLLARTRAHLLLVPERLVDSATQAAEGLPITTTGFDMLLQDLPEDDTAWLSDVPDQPTAYVQFSSGSTAEPKGVVVSQAALMANVDAIARHGLRMQEDDRAFSWLPLYHDMGLVGFSVVAMCAQRSVDYLAPMSFAARPLQWLRLMSACRSTITYAPLFAWHLAAQRYEGTAQDIDLSSLRIAGVGGDMVQAAQLDDCMRILASAGLRANAMQPSYGLAEATLAISMTDAAECPRVDNILLADAMGGTPVATATATAPSHATRRLVSAGRPLPGIEVQVRDAAGSLLPDRHVGHLWIRGSSVMQKYLDADAPRGANAFLDTGDLGYLHDGEIFVSGRAKDLVLVRGRNIWLQDIEWLAERVPPLVAGDTAAIAVDDDVNGSLVLLVQRAVTDADAQEALRQQLVDAVLQALGVTVRVLFLPARSLLFTTSGKLARQQMRQRYSSGAWDMVSSRDAFRSLAVEPTT